MFHRYSLHKITDPEQLSFDAAEYSLFKFGDGNLARRFGNELARGFIADLSEKILLPGENRIVPSPFHSIPTASCNMTTFFAEAVNEFLFRNGKKSLAHSKISRNMTYSEDYGQMSFEERVKLISSTSYEFNPEEFRNKRVFLVDDIRITGSHELVIRKMIEESGITGEFHFVYFAELINAAVSPTFENHLNYFKIKNTNDLISLFNSPTFVFNTRVVKYILKAGDDEFREFIESSPKEKLKELIARAIGNNYHLMQEYQNNLKQLINYTQYGY